MSKSSQGIMEAKPEDADNAAPKDALQYLTLTQPDVLCINTRLHAFQAEQKGRAFLIRLDTFIGQMSENWQAQSAQVWQYLNSSLAQSFPEPAWCACVNDTAWLAIIPSLIPIKGAMACADIYKGLEKFVTEGAILAPVELFSAAAESSDKLKLIKIDLDRFYNRQDLSQGNNGMIRPQSFPQGRTQSQTESQTQSQTQSDVTQGADLKTQTPMQLPVQNPSASIIHAGRNFKVASAVEPLFDMKSMGLMGHRLEPMVMETFEQGVNARRAQLSDMDWDLREQIDLTNIEQGLNILRMRSAEQRKIMMIVPSGFSTLASNRARTKILDIIGKAATELQMKIVFELRNLDGVPPTRIIEVVKLLKAFSLTVVANSSTDRKAIAALSHCGLSGLCFKYDGVNREETALRDYLFAVAEAAKKAGGACMFQGFDNYRQMAVARSAGVSHASIKVTAVMSTAPSTS